MKKKIFLNILGFYQMVCGLLGIYSTIAGIIKQSFLLAVQAVLFILPYFILLLVTGLYFFNKNGLRRAIRLTYISQSFQIIQFKIIGFFFFFICGSYLNFGIVNNNTPRFLIGHSWFAIDCEFRLGTAGEGFSFFINVVPLLIILLLKAMSPFLIARKVTEQNVPDIKVAELRKD